MPNWVENDLLISGNDSDITSLLAHVSSTVHGKRIDLDFSKLIPYPEEYDDADRRYLEFNGRLNAIYEPLEKMTPEARRQLKALYKEFGLPNGKHPANGYNNGGREWCLANWGTKWNACCVEFEGCALSGKVVIHFKTAWAPPIPVIERMASMFPTLEIQHEYYEGGAHFCGSAAYVGGRLVNSVKAPYFGARGG